MGTVGSLVDIEGADAGRDHVKVVGEQEARHVMLDFEFNAHFLLSETWLPDVKFCSVA